MPQSDRTTKLILLLMVLLLGIIALRPFFDPMPAVLAQGSRFDHVFIVSTMFLYRGQQGLLVMDRRNGNVWFIPKKDETFQEPMFLVRMQFEKLDQAPR